MIKETTNPKHKGINTATQYWNDRAEIEGRLTVVRRGYDEIDMKDITNHWWSVLKPHLQNSGDVLEIGCGWGRWASRINSVSKSYTGIDVSEKLIALGDKESNIHLSQPGTIPMDDLSFDVVLTVSVLQHVSDEMVSKMAYEIDRVLRPGGKVLAIENIGESYRSASKYIELLGSVTEIKIVGSVRSKKKGMKIFLGTKHS